MSQQRFLVLVLSLTVAFWDAVSQAQTPYYAGKTITIVAGTKAGDVYDLYARMFAQFMPKYIPGHPNIIVQNMPGAGSMIAANFVYNVASPDGLTIGAIFPALYFDQIVQRPQVKYDWNKFAWLGSPVTSNQLLYMRADSPYKTIHDVIKSSTAPKCGATGTSSTAYYLPKLLDEVIGTHFNIILGYQSGQDIDLAVERDEVVCRAFTITAFFAREPFITWRKKHFVNVLMQTGRKRDQRLKETPTIYELMDEHKTQQAGRSLATLVLAGGDFGRPYVMPPNTPAEQVKIIREAFAKTVNDEEVKADAAKKKLELDPSTYDELEKLAQEVTSQPPEIVAKMKKLLKK
ncbi:MAG TPA: tripartite tricarboxylate transporter substrate-binding protein [Terriglobales bacterium]|jgi:tripartite-type tricarboxylate transporter receptor subunit TctC|nr:tripartite tricarboxylate transporter substrate-binding protein [Terriglobales bacterium]